MQVALNREPGVRIKDVAADFGITESCLGNWLAREALNTCQRPGATTSELAEVREAKKRIRLLEIVTCIERTYHRRRRQAALGRLTPIEYETIMTPQAATAA